MEKDVLEVKMLGEFSLAYKDVPFSIERNSATKVNQLFEILLYYVKGIKREQLQHNLFVGENVVDPSNSLRALVFRLRKALLARGMPEDDFVVSKKGIYSFTDNFEVRVDAHQFEEIANIALNEADDNLAYDNLRKAVDMYAGDFLPMLSTTDWVLAVSVKLKKLYCSCADRLCRIYVNKKEYKSLYRLAEKTALLYPFEEWQAYMMEALVEQGMKKEAMKLYEDTETMMLQELGVSVGDKMQQMLERLGAQIRNNSAVISDVKDNLDISKPDRDGAFYCTYPVFVESYRYMKRVIQRNGQSAWLMLCTITDGKGYALDSSDRLYSISADLMEAISGSIRGGDMYTRYSDNQVLILLLGISQEDCKLVQNRINNHLESKNRKKYIQYHLTPICTLKEEDDTAIINHEIKWGSK